MPAKQLAGPLGLISAMPEELASVLAQIGGQCQRHAGRDFWVGDLHGQPVVAVLSRIGKVAAATTATTLIQQFGVRALVFTGVAGGLGAQVQVGDVVLAKALVQHDMDASPLFPRHEVPLYGRSHFDADAALCEALAKAAGQALATLAGHWPQGWEGVDLARARVHQGLIASGDRFVSGQHERARLLQALPEALAVEMEGAAIAQVCHDHGCPFACLRLVSDRADDSAQHDFLRLVRDLASPFAGLVLQHWLAGRAPAADLI